MSDNIWADVMDMLSTCGQSYEQRLERVMEEAARQVENLRRVLFPWGSLDDPARRRALFRSLRNTDHPRVRRHGRSQPSRRRS